MAGRRGETAQREPRDGEGSATAGDERLCALFSPQLEELDKEAESAVLASLLGSGASTGLALWLAHLTQASRALTPAGPCDGSQQTCMAGPWQSVCCCFSFHTKRLRVASRQLWVTQQTRAELEAQGTDCFLCFSVAFKSLLSGAGCPPWMADIIGTVGMACCITVATAQPPGEGHGGSHGKS